MSYKRFMRNEHGFTLVEVLVAMLVISFSLLLFQVCAHTMNKLISKEYQNEDHVGVAQLRLLMAQGEEINMQGETLYFQLYGKETYLTFHHSRLVKRPGYEIFLKDIDQGYFVMDGDDIYVIWQRKDKKYKALLTHV